MVFEEFVFALVVPPMIIPWAKSVETISADDNIAYNDGITGSHFAVGGMDRIMIPRQVSSLITDVPRLLTVAFRVRIVLCRPGLKAASRP